MYRIAGLRFAALLTFIASALAAESTSQVHPRGTWFWCISQISAPTLGSEKRRHQTVERLANANFNLGMPWF